MNKDKISIITILTEKEFQIFKQENKMEVSFINTLLHPKLLNILKDYMKERFEGNIYPISGLSYLDNNFIKLRDLNTDLGMSIFDYLSAGTGDILVELQTSIHNIVSIKISELFELNRFIGRIKDCSLTSQEIFRSNLFTDFSLVDSETYSFLPNLSFASCTGCLRIGDSWEKNYILDLKEKNNDVSLLQVF